MRDTKFRGKNKDIGWVEGQVAYDLNGDTYIIKEVEQDSSYGLEETILFATIWYRVNKETLGQYTGLKDKNGKEIYEGDIILYEDITKGLVRYSEKYAQYVLVNKGSVKDEFEPLGDYNMEVFEIIGNEYDNPDLLEKGAEE